MSRSDFTPDAPRDDGRLRRKVHAESDARFIAAKPGDPAPPGADPFRTLIAAVAAFIAHVEAGTGVPGFDIEKSLEKLHEALDEARKAVKK